MIAKNALIVNENEVIDFFGQVDVFTILLSKKDDRIQQGSIIYVPKLSERTTHAPCNYRVKKIIKGRFDRIGLEVEKIETI